MEEIKYFITTDGVKSEITKKELVNELDKFYDPFETNINLIIKAIENGEVVVVPTGALSCEVALASETEVVLASETEVVLASETEVALLAKMEADIALAKAELDKRKEDYETFKETLYQKMKESGVKSWESPNKKVLITRVDETTSETYKFDEEKFMAEHNELYRSYLIEKQIARKGYAKITIRKGKK